MKSTTSLLLFILSFSASFAQTGSSYLLMNYNLQSRQSYSFQLPGSSHYLSGREVFPIGIQWVKYKNQNSAMRYGFTIVSQPLPGYEYSYAIADTFYQQQKVYNVLLPKFSAGKEWQKHIHKDVAIYGGADAAVGFMKNSQMDYLTKYNTNQPYYYSQRGTQSGSAYILNLSLRPFTGIRVNWNRFVVGYEASVPVNYTKVFSEDIHKIEGPKLQHQINLGYRLNAKKRK